MLGTEVEKVMNNPAGEKQVKVIQNFTNQSLRMYPKNWLSCEMEASQLSSLMNGAKPHCDGDKWAEWLSGIQNELCGDEQYNNPVNMKTQQFWAQKVMAQRYTTCKAFIKAMDQLDNINSARACLRTMATAASDYDTKEEAINAGVFASDNFSSQQVDGGDEGQEEEEDDSENQTPDEDEDDSEIQTPRERGIDMNAVLGACASLGKPEAAANKDIEEMTEEFGSQHM
jgi:hypothetical protein